MELKGGVLRTQDGAGRRRLEKSYSGRRGSVNQCTKAKRSRSCLWSDDHLSLAGGGRAGTLRCCRGEY